MPWCRAGGGWGNRAPPRAPRGRLQMVPGLPREPAACSRGRLLSSFRGAAVPPLAPARRHAPRRSRPRAPPASLSLRDSARRRPPCARPPLATAPRGRAAGAAKTGAPPPARRLAGAPHPGRCRRPGPLCPGPRGGAFCAAACGRRGRGRVGADRSAGEV